MTSDESGPREQRTRAGLCTLEPDADLMIRKAQGSARARAMAAEASKGRALEAASETGVGEQIREFEEFFALELRAVRDTMEQVMALEAGNAELKAADWWHEQLTELHNVVSGAAATSRSYAKGLQVHPTARRGCARARASHAQKEVWLQEPQQGWGQGGSGSSGGGAGRRQAYWGCSAHGGRRRGPYRVDAPGTGWMRGFRSRSGVT